jgi:ATP-dependent RNA helicase DeaD
LNPFETYKDLGLPTSLLQSLEKMKFLTPTPVQAAAIPPALAGHDVLATAQTGTGKTGAFAVPLLTKLIGDHMSQALILVPTRELGAQIFKVLCQMGAGSKRRGTLVVGGESFGRQASDLYRGVDYIVATPGRLNDHLEEGSVNLEAIDTLILDEVDRMLDMGFAPQIKAIMRYVPKDRQTMLFSATLPDEIKSFAATFLRDPVRVAIGAVTEIASKVTEETIRTTNEGKNAIILKEMEAREGRVLVFTRTKSRTDRLARLLYQSGHDVVALHGGRTQAQRKQALDRFRSGHSRIMVATDLAGRGIDVPDIEHVINYDLPATRDDYIHRIGRTGRFGRTGTAINFLVSGDYEGERVISGAKAPAPRTVFRSSRRNFRRR